VLAVDLEVAVERENVVDASQVYALVGLGWLVLTLLTMELLSLRAWQLNDKRLSLVWGLIVGFLWIGVLPFGGLMMLDAKVSGEKIFQPPESTKPTKS
jgi:hypothetical protein